MTVLKIKGSRMFYRQAGAGTPVVLLHSSASSGAQWKDTIDELRSRHRVITPDLPGYGSSEVDQTQPADSLDTDAMAIVELIDRFSEPVHLVGHSFGAAVATKVAMFGGDRLRSLTLIEPALFHLLRASGADDQALFQEIACVEGVIAACAQDDDAAAGMAHFIDYWNGAGTWAALTPNVQDMYTAQIGRVLRDFTAGRNESWGLERAARISCPTFAYMGLDSRTVTQRTTEMLAETIPNASLTMVAEADHMLPLTHPHVIAPALKRHFAAAEVAEQNLMAPHAEFLPRRVA